MSVCVGTEHQLLWLLILPAPACIPGELPLCGCLPEDLGLTNLVIIVMDKEANICRRSALNGIAGDKIEVVKTREAEITVAERC